MSLKKYFIRRRKGESIEAEEIFLDAEAVKSIEDKGKMERPIKRRNFILFYSFIILCFIFLLSRAGYLQVVKGEYYHDLAQGNRLRIYPLSAPRGIIYDNKYNPLVYNAPSFDIVIDILDFEDNDDISKNEILSKISFSLSDNSDNIDYTKKDISVNTLKDKIEDNKGKVRQLILVQDISREATLVLESLINEWLGVRIEKNIKRQYIVSPYMTHILGYTGQVDSSDLDNYSEYGLNDQIGKMGIELEYENILRGVTGKRQIEVNSIGKKQNILGILPAVAGQGLLLHIDKDLQIKLYESLDLMLQKLKLQRAVGVIVNPNNGGVLAMVSLPSFDGNLFTGGLSKSSLEVLEMDSNNPFLNRAISGQYPSGSIIKPLIAAAALEENIIKPYQQINCAGVINIVNKYNPEIVYSFPDWKTHGLTDIIKAIAESCNVYFYAVGGGYGNIEGLGIERIKQYLQYFGLGQETNIDLPGEAVGLIPDQAWKKQVKPDEDWGLGDTYHVSIGQGDVLVTPIQMVSAIASLANGGKLYQMQIVDKIINSDGGVMEDVSPKIIHENFISQDNIDVVRKGMREAVISGSARSLSSLTTEVAGKTGTAQFGEDQLHSWFVGFAPYDNPQLSIVILIEGGGEGHTAAVPVAKDVLEWYFKN
ncbi:MAG: penicillin-binding protein 2 [bacterium]